MKILSLMLLGVLFPIPSIFAQSESITDVEFVYDAAGNRIEREIIYYESYQKSALATTNEEENIEFTEGLKVYPNPATESIFVSVNEEVLLQDSRMILIYDNTGRLVHQQEVYHEINRIDASKLISGSYVLKLIYGNQQREWIIIKH